VQSFWRIGEYPAFPSISENLSVDVLVVGGGITGVSVAYQLKKRGLKVCLVEAGRIAGGQTGRTTAHLTYVTDQPFHRVAHRIGESNAKSLWAAGKTAIDIIQQTIEHEKLSCDFRRIAGYYHVSPMGMDHDESEVDKELNALNRAGLDASFVPSAPLFRRPGIEFAAQAKFHPVEYVTSLAQVINRDGSYVFERSQVTEFHESPVRIRVNDWSISASDVVLATHVPLQGLASAVTATTFQTKIYPYMTYAVRARIPKDVLPEALFWDTHVPYYYVRIDSGEDNDSAIVGGKDHKTGQAVHPESALYELQNYAAGFLPAPIIMQSWSGQVVETHDGLPFIGKLLDHQYIATGFGGNGMTFGTLAGLMISEEIVKEANPWQELLSPHRKRPFTGAWHYVRENLDYPYYMVKDRIMRHESIPLEDIGPGEGAVTVVSGRKRAVYRDHDGSLHTLSPSCTHLGCRVHWNSAEKSWDCPCHGSRYSGNGKVIAGPAERDLQPVDLESSTPAMRPAIEPGERWEIPPNA
jgi:glycine/D-amino acid oxidase-like deaminating enzyme/nitrite reductase/ring-hydroxylating ferredoxin subunit